MKPEEIEKLLGGYASGTLNRDERKALLSASLTDQSLFNALVEEQALSDLLSDPGARQELLSALEPKSRRWFERPRSWALAGTFAMAAVAGVVLIRTARQPVLQTSLTTPALPSAPRDTAESVAQPAKSQRAVRQSAKPAKPNASRLVLPTPPPLQPQPAAAEIEAITVSEPTLETAAKVSAPAKTPDVHLAVLKRAPDGEYVEVDPVTRFQAGDSVRLRITPSAAGYLYLEQREGSGPWTIVSSSQVAANTEFTSKDIRFGGGPGEKTLRIVLAPESAARPMLSHYRSAESDSSRATPRQVLQPAGALGGHAGGQVVKEITLGYR